MGSTEPRRIADGGDGTLEHARLARLLEGAPRPVPTAAARERVWRSLGAPRKGRRLAWVVVPAGVAAAACAVVGLVLRAPAPASQPMSAAASAAGGFTLTRASGEVLAGSVAALAPAPAGRRLPDGSTMRTGEEAQAEIRIAQGCDLFVAERSEVAVEGRAVRIAEGTVSAVVAPSYLPSGLRLRARELEVRAIEARFTLAVGRAVEVRVEAGEVEIDGSGRAQRIGTGQCWSTRDPEARTCGAPEPLAPEPASPPDPPQRIAMAVVPAGSELPRPRQKRPRPPSPSVGPLLPALEEAPAPAPPTLPEEPDSPAAPEPTPQTLYEQAVRLARQGELSASLELLEALAARDDGLGALSLYELGRLRQRQTGELGAALASFEGYRRRFPAGSLRQEVDLSIIETELAMGHAERALRETEAFLVAHPSSERRRQLRLVRANLLRDRGACAEAREEYRALLEEAPASPQADDAAYFLAFCEAKLGQATAARASLERYLDQFPAGAHRQQAREALGDPGR